MSDLVQTYQWISIIGYMSAGVCFLVTLFLFFYLNIPQVWGYLTKHTERKAIEAIRAESEQKVEHTSQEMTKTRYVTQTDEIPSKNIASNAKSDFLRGKETTLLGESGETTLLEEEVHGQTVELSNSLDQTSPSQNVKPAEVVVLEEIILVHTTEIINEKKG